MDLEKNNALNGRQKEEYNKLTNDFNGLQVGRSDNNFQISTFHLRTCTTRQQLSLPRQRRWRESWRKTLNDLSLISKCAARGLTNARWAFRYKNTFHRPTLCWNKYLARVPLTIVVPRYFRLLDWALLLLLHWAVRVLWSESFHPFHLYLSSCYDPPVVRLTNWLICSWWSIGWNNPLIFWKCHHPICQKLGLI